MSDKMASESTPLLATAQVGPPRRRYPHNVLRRFCTIALSSTLLALVIVFLVTVVWSPGHCGHHRHRPGYEYETWSWPGCKSRRLGYDQLKEILLETPSSEKASEWSKYYTAGAHLAGQNYSQVRHECCQFQVESYLADNYLREGCLDEREVGGMGCQVGDRGLRCLLEPPCP